MREPIGNRAGMPLRALRSFRQGGGRVLAAMPDSAEAGNNAVVSADVPRNLKNPLPTCSAFVPVFLRLGIEPNAAQIGHNWPIWPS
jgi:hypothetical protein